MWVVFRKSDKEVVATSAHARKDRPKQVAIREAVGGRVKRGPVGNFDAVQVRDDAEARAILRSFHSGGVVIAATKDGSLKPEVRSPEAFRLIVETDVSERHPVDGIPLIPADGTSAATVQVKKIHRDGKAAGRRQDNDELWLRTDQGELVDDRGEPVRSLRLARGQASFRLRSGNARRLATVQVLSADPNVDDAALRIEFV